MFSVFASGQLPFVGPRAAPGGGTSHRYWRVYITATNGSAFVAVGDLLLRTTPGGTSACFSAGAPFRSTAFDFLSEAYRAFDGTNGFTTWASDGSALPQWIGWDFGGSGGTLGLPAGTPQAIVEFAIVHRSDGNTTQAPMDFKLQYSDDGSTYTDHIVVTGETGWSAGETRVFS